MAWLIALPLGLAIVYLAARYGRFRSWIEPVLSIAVALALSAAFLVWLNESAPDEMIPAPAPDQPETGLTADDIVLENMTVEPSQTRRSYRVRGTAANASDLALEYFRLTVTLEDCPQGACRHIGDDTALILLRVPGGQSRPFETFLTFPFRPDEAPTAPKWSYRVSEVRGSSRR